MVAASDGEKRTSGRTMTPDKIRYAALLLMIPIILLSTAALSVPELRTATAHGPIQSGHAELGCADCHEKPDASWRQQIQANVQYAIGLRVEPVDFGYQTVTSATCLGCHERPNDRHPIYRFREPRFQDALTAVDATSCLGCHSEHTDARSFASVDFCSACHEDLQLKSDPIDVPHHTLIAEENWSSCLGCHDFHGNHTHKVPTVLSAVFSVEDLKNYLAAGPSPYGSEKRYEAKTK